MIGMTKHELRMAKEWQSPKKNRISLADQFVIPVSDFFAIRHSDFVISPAE